MVAALKGADILSPTGPTLPASTKQSTVNALASRGLVSLDRYLTPEGVEAARQLGNDTTTYNDPAPIEVLEELLEGDPWSPEKAVETTEGNPAGITPEMVTQAAQNILKAVDLDEPHTVPNREDKRKVKFQLRGALSRLKERQRVKRMKKYGSVPTAQVV
jgi:hypothetical protein